MTSSISSIPLLDLKAQYAHIRDEVSAEIQRLCEQQAFIMGEPVARLEREIAAYCEAGSAAGCASGSDAILLALRTLGVGAGDEVLTVPYSFFATAGYIVHSGARPVFVDIEPGTFNLDVAQLEAALDRHPRVKVIMPVHLFGQCADMDPIVEVARRRGLYVVEDAAQSIGAEYKGRRAGSLGDVACFSFYPGKNLGAFGDAGMVTLNGGGEAAAGWDHKIRALRIHGSHQTYVHEWVGWNSRLDALQAAVLSVKLRYLDGWTAARQRNAELYRQLLPASMTPPVAPYATRHVHNQFVIRSQRRDALQQHLKAHGVGTAIYYPIPLHLQQCFEYLGYAAGAFPESERAARETLAIPVHPEMTREQVERVAELIREFEAAG